MMHAMDLEAQEYAQRLTSILVDELGPHLCKVFKSSVKGITPGVGNGTKKRL
jgi:hypothetical protein